MRRQKRRHKGCYPAYLLKIRRGVFKKKPSSALFGFFQLVVGLILGCRAIKQQKVWVNLHYSVVTIEQNGKLFTFSIANFLKLVKDERDGLDGKERKLITQVLKEQPWTHIFQDELKKPMGPSLVNELDIPSQIINMLEKEFGLNTFFCLRNNASYSLETTKDGRMLTGDEGFMSNIYEAIKSLAAQNEKKWTETDLLTKLEKELLKTEAKTDTVSFDIRDATIFLPTW
eukprot:GHVT01023705.1.p1 GENE.GHVT01023705.1~~GHVT01023705.1.p1  ORF type:complete len:229 (-),score=26.89 GHVT01023705.1:819-1505(-)